MNTGCAKPLESFGFHLSPFCRHRTVIETSQMAFPERRGGASVTLARFYPRGTRCPGMCRATIRERIIPGVDFARNRGQVLREKTSGTGHATQHKISSPAGDKPGPGLSQFPRDMRGGRSPPVGEETPLGRGRRWRGEGTEKTYPRFRGYATGRRPERKSCDPPGISPDRDCHNSRAA